MARSSGNSSANDLQRLIDPIRRHEIAEPGQSCQHLLVLERRREQGMRRFEQL